MKIIKGYIGIKSVLAVLTIFGMLIPMTANASVSPTFVDFGEVVVGTSSTRTLSIINTNAIPIDVTLSIIGNECGFSVNPRSLSIGVASRGLVQVSFAPREAISCSARLIVEIVDSLQIVPLMGIGILPPPPPPPQSPPPPPPPSTIMIGDVDTGIMDTLYEGQLISDWIEQCAREAKNHGKFVSCVSHLTNDLKREGVITKEEKKIITKCAAQAKIPR